MADPFWNNVVTLLNFEGANNSNISVNSANNASPPEHSGVGCVITDVRSKFGSTSVYIPNNAYVSTGPKNTGAGEDYEFGSSDWTVEGWFNIPAEAGIQHMVFAYGNDSPTPDDIPWSLAYNTIENTFIGSVKIGDTTSAANTMVFDLDTDGAATGPAGHFNDTFSHIHLTRNGGNIIIGIDGFNVVSTGLIPADAALYRFIDDGGVTPPSIGGSRSGLGNIADDLPMYVDEFRITKGVARYTGATYDVPTAAFSTSGGGGGASISGNYGNNLSIRIGL